MENLQNPIFYIFDGEKTVPLTPKFLFYCIFPKIVGPKWRTVLNLLHFGWNLIHKPPRPLILPTLSSRSWRYWSPEDGHHCNLGKKTFCSGRFSNSRVVGFPKIGRRSEEELPPLYITRSLEDFLPSGGFPD